MEEAKRLHWTSILIEAQQFSWSLFVMLIVSSGNLRPSQLLTLFGIENIGGAYLEYILGMGIVFPLFFWLLVHSMATFSLPSKSRRNLRRLRRIF